MTAILILFFTTFMLFPIIVTVTYQFVQFSKVASFFKVVAVLFLLYDVLLISGFSFTGDIPDYLLLSIEYLTLCFALCLKPGNQLTKLLAGTGRLAVIIGFVVGITGIFLFWIFVQNYVCDKKFHFVSYNEVYETRRYSFGHATLENTSYTFITYKQYSFLKLEKKTDRTDFFDDETELNIWGELSIRLQKTGNEERIIFEDNEGRIYSKPL